MSAFVAGATGYTGREVVRVLRERGVATVAHVRPDSPELGRWRERFGAIGATVDATPWEPAALAATLGRVRPDVVFALLGTTRARAREAEHRGVRADYETVDFGLTMMLLDAARGLSPRPVFVYLSAVGAGSPRGAYMRARHRVERELAKGELSYRIARPSFISGPDRDEVRTGERVAATVADGALAALGMLGGKRLRDRWRSTSGAELAGALVRLALDEPESRVYEAEELRARPRAAPPA